MPVIITPVVTVFIIVFIAVPSFVMTAIIFRRSATRHKEDCGDRYKYNKNSFHGKRFCYHEKNYASAGIVPLKLDVFTNDLGSMIVGYMNHTVVLLFREPLQ